MHMPNVKTSVYEGPLDLLLELIEKRKLLINDISLASVTDEYIARVNNMTQLEVEELSCFVSLAATLLLIKSRSLLPTLALTTQESKDIKQLEYRLAIYQIIKESAQRLRDSTSSRLYSGTPPKKQPRFSFDPSITTETLRAAAQTLIEGFPKAIALPEVAVRTIRSLEEAIASLSQRVSQAISLSFIDLTRKNNSDLRSVKHEIVITFLALLELVKQGIIKATQEENGDIRLEPDTVSVPYYASSR